MAGDNAIPSKLDSTPIEVKYEDIPEERRKQFEAQLKKEQEEAMRGFLACYGKTRQGIVEKEKFVMPTFTPLNPSTTTTTSSTSGTSNVSFTTDSIKQFIDAFCSRFEESHKLTQDLLIDMNLQLNGNRGNKVANGYSNEIPNASSSPAQT